MEINIDIRDLRSRLNWKRSELAAYLRIDLSTVSRLENGQVPHGSTGRLLELLERASTDDGIMSVLLNTVRGEHDIFDNQSPSLSRKSSV